MAIGGGATGMGWTGDCCMKPGAFPVVELEKLRLAIVSGGEKLLSRSSTSIRIARASELDGWAALLIQEMVRSKSERS